MIKSPKKYSNLPFTEAMDKFRWTKKRGKDFNEVVLKLPMNVRCSRLGYDEWLVSGNREKNEISGRGSFVNRTFCSIVVQYNDVSLTQAICGSCSY